MIRRRVKNLMASGLGWRVTARCMRVSGVTVLMYHRITSPGSLFPGTEVSTFREQMSWLNRNCRTIAPEDFDEVAASAAQSGSKPPVLVTFDDGYRDFHDNAYPILEELQISSIVFLTTGLIDHGGMIWTDLVTFAVRTSRRRNVTLPWDTAQAFRLDLGQPRTEVERAAKRFLKSVPDLERRNWQTQLMDELGFGSDDIPAERQMLNWDEVRATMELTRFGGHTHTHPILSRLDEVAVDEEIRRCRDRIEEETGIAPRYFAYPNGRACDYTEFSMSSLQRHGFELGFTTVPGIHRPGADRFQIRRQPTAARSLGDFASLVAGR